MIPGVHTQIVVFVNADQVKDLLEQGLWRDAQGSSSSTELSFTGSHTTRFLVRLGSVVRHTRKVATCTVQLESPEERFRDKLRGTLEFTAVPEGSATKIRLQGMAARQLAGAQPTISTEEIRRLANDYARQLLDEIAFQLERVSARQPQQSASAAAGS